MTMETVEEDEDSLMSATILHPRSLPTWRDYCLAMTRESLLSVMIALHDSK